MESLSFVLLLSFLCTLTPPHRAVSQASCTPQWQATFGGVAGTTSGIVYAQIEFDDGSGPARYVAGSFNSAGGVEARGIARWDGSRWSKVGTGLGLGTVHCLAVFDDGTGPALYAGGTFEIAGGQLVNRIAKWDGTSWSALGGGVSHDSVYALAVFDDGSGPALYAAGSFGSAGGTFVGRIAKWNGTSWSPLGSGVNNVVFSLAVFDDGGGSALYAAGWLTIAGGGTANLVAKWDGASWSSLGTGVGNHQVNALAVFDDGAGPALFAGGLFDVAGGVSARNVAKWDGTSWSPLGAGVSNIVHALTVFDDGNGPALYVGGFMSQAGGISVNGVAKWDGAGWSALGPGAMDTYSFLAQGGVGGVLHVGGGFDSVGDLQVRNLATWDGSGWSALPSGVEGEALFGEHFADVRSLTTFDDGGGPALFVAGSFTHCAQQAVNRIARWDGTSWSALGSGISGISGGSGSTTPVVQALQVYDEGGTSALYAAGAFNSAGGVPAFSIAKWDGATWSAVGGGLGSMVYALQTYDDGSGSALYAGGLFSTMVSGVTVNRIARWDGTRWSALGSGVSNAVKAMAVYDDGAGPALFVGGLFTTAGGGPRSFIAKWDGQWRSLGSGTNGNVEALQVFDDGNGAKLYAAGQFTSAGGVPVHQIARWDGSSWEGLGGVAVRSFETLTVFDDGMGAALYTGATLTDGSSRVARWTSAGWSLITGSMSPTRALRVFDDGSGPALFAGGEFVTSRAGDSYLARFGGCTPTIDVVSLVPDHGPVRGGNRIHLLGSGFAPATSVTFGGQPASATFLSPTLLEVVVPPGSLARPRIFETTVDVVATTPYGGRDVRRNGYAYTRL